MRFHSAAMQNDAMPDADKISQNRGISVAGHMQHARVLNIGAVANPNVIHIATHHRVEPDAGMVADDNITNHLSAVFDKDPGSHLRELALIATKHGGLSKRSLGGAGAPAHAVLNSRQEKTRVGACVPPCIP